MKIVIIDGQGGRIGALMSAKIKASAIEGEIIAIGTNSIATAAMLKAGADYGATGENPVIVNAKDADIIIGPIGIIAADSLLGEITAAMAAAVASSPAAKILLPINKCNLHIIGFADMPVSEFINQAIQTIETMEISHI